MFQSDSVAFSATGDGIFIPATNLSGIEASELATSESLATRLGKFIYSFSKTVANYCDANPDVVGVSVTREESVNTGVYGVKTKTFAFVFQKVSDDRYSGVSFPTPASSGIRAGLADFSFLQLFPGAVKVASGDTTLDAGVVLMSGDLAEESMLNHASIDLAGDCRELVRAIVSGLYTNRALRTADTASGLTAASYGSVSAATIPSLWTQELNPYTGLMANVVRYLSVKRRTVQFSIETVEDEDAQTFDVNSVALTA